MSRAAPPGALELLLHKATDPSSPEENWECIQRFIDQVNANDDSSTAALRLLEHKIQSPQEAEALHALTVLEMCVNNCGERFHHEMGKFRFLNSLIKVLSPKYLGDWSTERVKSRIIEVMFSWTVWFPEEVKIRDAYQMLKKQGIVKQDPKLPEDKILPPPSPRPASSIFDADREKSQLLARLLKSKNPEDLQAANRLIKGLIKEEQEKSAKESRRAKAVQEALGSAEALAGMLNGCKASWGVGIPQASLEALQGLEAKCEKLKPLLFRIASETVEDEEALEVLQANDRLTQTLGFYQQVVGACRSALASPADVLAAQPPPNSASSPALISFMEAEEDAARRGNAQVASSHSRLPSSSHSLDEELMALDLLSSPTEAPPSSSTTAEVTPLGPPSPLPDQSSLASLFIPLDSITLSTIPPVTVYEGKGLKVVLHFSREAVPGWPTIQVMVLSMLSTAPHPLWDIVFQAAVPKSMTIKLQQATGSRLPAFNPLQPPPMISQVLLLANPQQFPLRLRYRLLFTQDEKPHCEVGEVTNFPPAELWSGS
ncbi:ADP-ribosylation factor-binding protein GGA2 isoform X2 [Tiliqua scincoides]|uniref:ADP-ribosylation factor-binding protein GGA2 isoform X2 n=1 Tax=Tiliqua scincoides TaxID=71010 RepID=UPI0034631C76